jgi:hypothetical protein
MPYIESDQLAILMNIKLEFHQNPQLRDQFIDLLISNHPEFTLNVFNAVTHKDMSPLTWNDKTWYLTQSQWDDIISKAAIGLKVECIKAVRSVTEMGLKEAKEYCEASWPLIFGNPVPT